MTYEIENIPVVVPVIPVVKPIQDDEFYGATPEQRRMYLKQRQSLPLSVKVALTKRRIVEWYEAHDGKVYIAFSGGKDSSVLKDIVRSIYPEVPCVFADTGLEYPELKEFVRTVENVIVVKPEKNFKQVINEYGYPVISKSVARKIRDLQNPTDKNFNVNNLSLTGIKMDGSQGAYQSKLSNKWVYLKNAPFKISEKCCDFIKKNPCKVYEKETGRVPFVGTMTDDSLMRESAYLQTGCNNFNGRHVSLPLAFWTEQDILECLYNKWVSYCKIYGEIVLENGVYRTTGEHRTGCMFCMFGVHLEKQPNRFQRMKLSHPDYYD